MAREIKFRAWDRFNECYWYSDKYNNLADFFVKMQELSESGNALIFEQFTGLRNKNGKEIYERDYLKNPKGEIGCIIWHEAGFVLECKRKNGSLIYITLTQGFVNNKEIIGNSLESLEILK